MSEQTTKDKLGTAKRFTYGSPNNPIMYSCMIAIQASNPDWTTGDFEKIVREIQAEAYAAGFEKGKNNLCDMNYEHLKQAGVLPCPKKQ